MKIAAKAAFTPGQHVARQHCVMDEQPVSGYIYVDGHMLPGNKLLVRDTCWLYLGDIIRPTIHLCHSRLVSLCIQQQTGNKLATILLPIQETCWRRQDTICRQLVASHYIGRTVCGVCRVFPTVWIYSTVQYSFINNLAAEKPDSEYTAK